MITTVYTIDNLKVDIATIKSQQYYNSMKLGDEHVKTYVNDMFGREELIKEVPETQANAVLSVWDSE